MVKIVDMTSALKQVRESISTTGATRKPTSKDDKLYLSNPNEWRRRYELEKTYKDILRTMPASEKNTEAGKIKAMDLARVKSAKNSKNLKLNMKNKGTLKLEDLDKDDVKTIKPIIKQLQKSVKSHDKQAKQLTKDISDEKDLEEQAKELEEQLKTAEKELEELYIKEDKAYVIRFQRIADKERMVVVFKKQSEADMYADNIKKQGGKVFSNKLEKIPYKVVDRKSK